jgi:hypothetical protein
MKMHVWSGPDGIIIEKSTKPSQSRISATPSQSSCFAPCFASIHVQRIISRHGLPIKARVTGTNWISSICSQRKKNFV